MRNPLTLITLLILTAISSSSSARPLILLSIDGFKGQYLETISPPFLTKLIKQSAYSRKLQPVFPSLTFPNHLSIVTGNYPENHGIVGNSFYHPLLHQSYHYQANKKDSRFIASDTIWSIAEKNQMISAVYFWPESETPIKGHLPHYYRPYKNDVSNQARLAQLISWLKLPKEKRPSLLLSYFSTVDTAGHLFGPNSPEVKEQVLAIDKTLENFFAALKQHKLSDVDVLIVSDHGMTPVDETKTIAVNELSLPKHAVVRNNYSELYVYTTRRILSRDKAKLKAEANGRYTVLAKGSYPSHWHFDKQLSSIPDLVLSAKPPHLFKDSGSELNIKGSHGFDPLGFSDMDALFIAHGPSFKPQQLEKIANIDIMPLMLTLLKLPPPAHLDGKWSRIKKIVKQTAR